MQLDRPIRVVTPTVDGDVLAVLARADAEFTPPEVHGLVGDHSEDGVRKALQRLSGQGIVRSRRAGNAVLYQLNRRHLAAGAVVELARLRDTLLARLRDRFDTWPVRPAYAALFGSAATGRMRSDSDIDIFVVRPDKVDSDDQQWRTQLLDLEMDVSSWVGNDVRVLEYSDKEVAAGLATADRILIEVGADGIHLAGPARYLSNVRRRSS